jgi:hypothetical protein
MKQVAQEIKKPGQRKPKKSKPKKLRWWGSKR